MSALRQVIYLAAFMIPGASLWFATGTYADPNRGVTFGAMLVWGIALGTILIRIRFGQLIICAVWWVTMWIAGGIALGNLDFGWGWPWVTALAPAAIVAGALVLLAAYVLFAIGLGAIIGGKPYDPYDDGDRLLGQ